MLRINDTIFSFDILEKKFRCDLPVCLGNCCRYGDSGAPVSDEEAQILENIFDKIEPFLRPEGLASIKEKGTSVTAVSYTHLRAHETDSYLVCRLLLEK